jgi:hypothetical protein
MIYSLPPLLPSSSQPPLLPLPPKYATFFPAPPPLPTTTTVPAEANLDDQEGDAEEEEETAGAGDAAAASGERGARRPRAGSGQAVGAGPASRAGAAAQQPAAAQFLPDGGESVSRGGRHPPPAVGACRVVFSSVSYRISLQYYCIS